jgi:hypothetical protein
MLEAVVEVVDMVVQLGRAEQVEVDQVDHN